MGGGNEDGPPPQPRKRRPELRPSDGVSAAAAVLSGDQRHLGRASRCALHQPARHPVAGSPDALAFIAWAQISRIGLASCFLSADADVAPKYRSRSQAPSKLHDQPTTDVGPTDWRRLHVRASGYLYFGRWRQPGWCDDSGSVARPVSARTPAGRVARLRVLMMGVVRRSAKGTVDDGESRRCGRGAGLLSPGDDRAARSHPRVQREGRAVSRSGDLSVPVGQATPELLDSSPMQKSGAASDGSVRHAGRLRCRGRGTWRRARARRGGWRSAERASSQYRKRRPPDPASGRRRSAMSGAVKALGLGEVDRLKLGRRKGAFGSHGRHAEKPAGTVGLMQRMLREPNADSAEVDPGSSALGAPSTSRPRAAGRGRVGSRLHGRRLRIGGAGVRCREEVTHARFTWNGGFPLCGPEVGSGRESTDGLFHVKRVRAKSVGGRACG